MKRNRYQLLFYSCGLVCVMYICFSIFRLCNNKAIAYFGPYSIYLMLLFIGYQKFKVHIEEIPKQKEMIKLRYYIVSFIPVVATFIIAFIPTISHMPIWLFLGVIIYSVLNGTLEELFWRYTFNRVYEEKIILAYVIPTVLFTSWHFSLLLCKNMLYNGGAVALVGGAGFMGAIWGYVMFRTKDIRITIMAHIFVNLCAFSQLLYCNFG